MTQTKLAGTGLLVAGVLVIASHLMFGAASVPTEGPLSGVLTHFANAAINQSLSIEAATYAPTYIYMLGANALIAFLMMVGVTGIPNYDPFQSGAFKTAAFALAFSGSAFFFAHAWGHAFFMHAMADAGPQSFDAMSAADTPLLLIETLIAFGLFALGWILFCFAIIGSRALSPIGPILVIAGLLAAPLLSSVSGLPVSGGLVSSGCVGLGLVLMGLQVISD